VLHGDVHIEVLTHEDCLRGADVVRHATDIIPFRDLIRVDLRVAHDGSLHVIDINAVPGIKPDECYLALAACVHASGDPSGFSRWYGALLSAIVQAGAARYGVQLPVESVPLPGITFTR
jgi:hypothetical protein